MKTKDESQIREVCIYSNEAIEPGVGMSKEGKRRE